MQPAAYPAPPVLGAEPLKPSGWWFVVAGGVAVAGIAAAIAVFVATISGLVDRVDDFQRVDLPGSDTVTLETGGYTVYHEFAGASGTSGSFVPVSITAPDGSSVALEPYSANVTYSWGGHEGIAAYSFTAEEPGEYRVSSEGDVGFVAIGRGIGSGLAGGLVGAFALGIGGVLAGGIIAVVVGVRRGRDRRSRQTYGPPYGPGPPGGGWPAAGWPGATPPGVPGGPYPPVPYPPGSYAPQQPPPGPHPPSHP